MRITFFNRSYYPDGAATGQLLTELAERLAGDYGLEVSVVAGPPLVGSNGNQSKRLRNHDSRNRVEIFRANGTTFKPHRFSARAVNYSSYFLSACIKGLSVRRPDIIVSFTDPPIIGLAALLAARRSKAKFVFVCQDIFPEVARLMEGFRSRTLEQSLDKINRLLLRKADRVVALGKTMEHRLINGKGCDPRKISVIHNWADCSEITPGPKRNAFSVAHGLADKFVVMHSGNIGLSQGLEMVIEGAQRLQHIPEIQFVFVGDGVKKAALEKQVRSMNISNVRFLPYEPKESLKDSFATADVFIVSLKRGLAGYIVPSKLYSILAAGRPYVAAVEEECEVTTITKQHNCGLLAQPGDSVELAEKILTLYRNQDLVPSLGTNARKAAFQFDRSAGVHAYYDLFCKLAGVKSEEDHRRYLT